MKITKEMTAIMVVAIGVAIACVLLAVKPILTVIALGAVATVGVGVYMYFRNRKQS